MIRAKGIDDIEIVLMTEEGDFDKLLAAAILKLEKEREEREVES